MRVRKNQVCFHKNRASPWTDSHAPEGIASYHTYQELPVLGDCWSMWRLLSFFAARVVLPSLKWAVSANNRNEQFIYTSVSLAALLSTLPSSISGNPPWFQKSYVSSSTDRFESRGSMVLCGAVSGRTHFDPHNNIRGWIVATIRNVFPIDLSLSRFLFYSAGS